MNEDKTKQELEKKFGYLAGAVTSPRKGRVSLQVPLDKFKEVFDYAVKALRFSALSAITGSDEVNSFSVIYHLNSDGEIVLSLKVSLNRAAPAVKTVTAYFPGADIYERELMDLLGIKVEGLTPGHRYPLPDEWPKDEYPLRKDWKKENSKTEVPNA